MSELIVVLRAGLVHLVVFSQKLLRRQLLALRAVLHRQQLVGAKIHQFVTALDLRTDVSEQLLHHRRNENVANANEHQNRHHVDFVFEI